MSFVWSRWVKRAKDITVILTCMSITVGVMVTLTQMRSSWKQTRLVGLSQAKEIFEQEDEIQREVNIFMNVSTVPDKKKVDSLKATYGSGRSMYYSKELARYQRIAHHYERVGALLKFGYLDFDLYYEVFAFPTEFWNQTKELRNTIKNNWHGDKPLDDFLCNAEYVNSCFEKKRNSLLTIWKRRLPSLFP